MDGFLVIIALVVLSIPIAVIALIVGQSRLRSRVAMLEGQVFDLRQEMRSRTADGHEPGTKLAPIAVSPPPAAATLADRWAPGAKIQPDPDIPPEFLDTNDKAEAAPAAAAPVSIAASTEAAPEPASEPAPEPEVPSGPIVMRRDRVNDLGTWLQRNCIYVVSAASLALAGVFLVQYSVQNGLLPPQARVIAAFLFGFCLIGAGEWLRRRKGDGERSDTAYIPSAFAGAGIVTLFAATIAAEQLYFMIDAPTAFGQHFATAARPWCWAGTTARSWWPLACWVLPPRPS